MLISGTDVTIVSNDDLMYLVYGHRHSEENTALISGCDATIRSQLSVPRFEKNIVSQCYLIMTRYTFYYSNWWLTEYTRVAGALISVELTDFALGTARVDIPCTKNVRSIGGGGWRNCVFIQGILSPLLQPFPTINSHQYDTEIFIRITVDPGNLFRNMLLCFWVLFVVRSFVGFLHQFGGLRSLHV
jgi:hypothetical protein